MAEDGTLNTDSSTDDTGAGGGSGGNWYDSLPDDLKGNDTLKGYDGVESLAKAHLTTQEENATLKQQIEAGKPVVPDKPEGYELPAKFEGLPDDLSAEISQSVAKAALEAGLSKEATAKLYNAIAADELQTLKDEAAAIDKARTETETALKKDLGDKYAEKMSNGFLRCVQIAGKVGINQDDFKAFIDGTGIGDNPTFIKFAISLADLISPDNFETNSGTEGGGKPFYDHPSSKTK